MPVSLEKPARAQTQAEEIANSISHGVGLVAAIIGTPFIIVYSLSQDAPAGYIVGICVYSSTIILLYLSSTIYHALPIGKTKHVFRIVEHSAIYLLIAGTYTPFTLGVLFGPWGWSLFGAVWGLAIGGVSMKVFGRISHPVLSVVLYLLMGWTIVIAVEPIFERMQFAGLVWLLAGGLSYTIGVVFFAIDSLLKFGHFIWHLFVIGGSICHYFAVLWYAV